MLETALINGVHEVLGPDGMLVRDGGGNARFNQNQLDYAIQIAKGFCRSREDMAASVNIQQAGTGTGKTLGYLVPAFLHAAHTKGRVIVSTFTRHLQHQILTGDGPRAAAWVTELTGVKLSLCRRVGKQNYLSRAACNDLHAAIKEKKSKSAPPGEQEAIQFMDSLCEWLMDPTLTAPLLDDYLFAEGCDSNLLPAGIDRNVLCINENSPSVEIEAYKVDVQRTHGADVVITNHALTMLNAFRWAAILDGDTRQTDILICDEADRLADAAESVLGADVSLHRLIKLSENVSTSFNLPGIVVPMRLLHDSAKGVEDQGRLLALMPDTIKAHAICALNAALPHARAFVEKLSSKKLDLDAPKKELMAEFVDAVSDLQQVCSSSGEESNTCVISWSPVKEYPSLRIGNPNPARIITRMLAPRNWDIENQDDGLPAPPRSYLKHSLFTSATLATPGKTLPAAFDAFANTIGIIRHPKNGRSSPIHNVTVDLYRSFEPRNFGQMTFVLPDPQAPSPTFVMGNGDERTISTSMAWLKYCAKMIRAASTNPGRTLALALSFEDVRLLGMLLIDVPNLIVHHRGEAIAGIAQRYKNTPDAVLITPTGWEGLDLPGLVNQLVITRIPYSPPGGFRASLNEVVLRNKGMSEDKIQSVLHAQALDATRRKLSQGIGRGIRSADDVVRVWIADPRFPQPESFSGSLDEVLMTPCAHSQKQTLRACIPARFMGSFSQAKLFLLDGTVYAPEVI